MKKSSCKLLNHLWREHPGQSNPPEEKKGKKKKGGGGKTVSGIFLSDLTALMATLHSTEPHFVRCIVPNNHKQPGGVEAPLIMHQLTCNGVLEGIRICMRGFPNRILYADFKQRYAILGQGKVSAGTEGKSAAGTVLEMTPGFEAEKYRIGHTKVFFRAGALAMLEEARDDIVMKLVRYTQGAMRGYASRKSFENRKKQRELIKVIQRTFRSYMRNRDWGWFKIIQKTRPLIGMVNVEEELAILESMANDKFGAYEEQLETKKRLESENEDLKGEILGLKEKLTSEQGDLSSYEEKIAKISTQKADLEVQLAANQEKLVEEERYKAEVESDSKDTEKIYESQARDYQDLVVRQEKLDNEILKRDNIIKSLNDDVAAKDETLSKLNREKKQTQQKNDTAGDELVGSESKVNHLTEVKVKLEQTLDEMDTAVEREKRSKYNTEKERRRLEGDLKMSQGSVSDLEREKREMEQNLMRKETEIHTIVSKLEDEQGSMGRIQRSIKELTTRIDELEDELEAERQGRAKAEKQKSDLAREFDELKDRLDETSVATESQKGLNKKRDNEIIRMKKDMEENNIQQESTLMSLKKKHQEAIVEIGEQIDQLSKLRAKFDKDKLPLKMQIDDTRVAFDHVTHERALVDKNLKASEIQLKTLQGKMGELAQTLNDYDSQNKRLLLENSSQFTKLEELLNISSMLQKTKISLTAELDQVKQGHEEEVKERQALLGRYRNAEHEFDGVKELFDDICQQKEESARILQKVAYDANNWRNKYENEAVSKIEELEAGKLKLQARLTESESTLGNLNNKLVSLEKYKQSLDKNVEDAKQKLDQALTNHDQAEKKIKMMDRFVSDWRRKADDLSKELSLSQMEQRNIASELFRVKNGKAEGDQQLDEILRENKTLSEEIKDLMEQISDGGRTIHEIEKQRKRTEVEKADLESALSEAETALEFEETKLLKLTLELNQLKADIDKRIQEKEEEFEGTRRNHSKAMEHIQFAIEEESKLKAEAIRSKKKLEQDITELDSSLQRSSLENADIQKNVKKHQDTLRSKMDDLENAKRETESYREYMINSERKANSLKNSVEEARSMLEQSDKSRRQTEQELSDCHEESAKFTVQNAALDSNKRKLEGDLHELQLELEEVGEDLKERERKARDCMIDASKMAEELHLEQEQSGIIERERNALESRVRDLQVKLEDAENNSIKYGKKMIGKLEEKLRELVAEIDDEERRRAEALKNLKKTERGVNEYLYRSNEDTRNSERIKDLIDRMQQQVRMFKKQLEEAEDIAANNLAKFKVVQKALFEAQERAGETESEVDRKKGLSRGVSLAREF
eukprot:GFUD01018148.1.p1 GENE.GFUD01018148.1~~GFUD01018148.1.p1  ORF type:complete len:1458 (+),score=511.32 GFUD01018148.1:400-4374(+)